MAFPHRITTGLIDILVSYFRVWGLRYMQFFGAVLARCCCTELSQL